MEEELFSQDEKAEMFDEIASHYYGKNFGCFSKADMDLLMFHYYVNKQIDIATNSSGEIDFAKCSDYAISRKLGITQQRVKNLKIKDQLVYPDEKYKDWQTMFSKLIKNARIDDNKIIISIPDPNLYLEIENYIEESGKYIEKQFNHKLMIMRIEAFIELCLISESEETKKQIVKKLKKQFKESNIDEKKFDEKNIGKTILETTMNLTTIAANISSLFSPHNVIASSFFSLVINNFD